MTCYADADQTTRFVTTTIVIRVQYHELSIVICKEQQLS